jgi:diguanylate cyclase (GGDEF)-like protein
MNNRLVTRADVWRRTARIVALSVGATVVLGWLMSILLFGIDPDATVRGGYATTASLVIGVLLAAALSGGLSYRSSCLLRELTRAQAELLRLACTDQLTGLQNRRGFDEAATAAIADASEANLPAVALMCDIDHFKAINDRFGHEFGDAVLTQIGEVLRAFAADNDILVARHGGEEFAALMVGATPEQAMAYAEGLRQLCALREISHKGTSINVTVSVGIAASQGSADLTKLIRAADDALYAAKRRGRNCVVRADSVAGIRAA